MMKKKLLGISIFEPVIIKRALKDSFIKLNPMLLYKNPIIFIVEIVSFVTTAILLYNILFDNSQFLLDIQLVCWLWFTVLFANFAESIAESRGKAQAETLRRTKRETRAKLIKNLETREYTIVDAKKLQRGDIVLVEVNDIIPLDGEIIEGIASVDESAITGESAPVLRESGGDRSAVTGGTRVISDFVIVKITVEPGESFLDRMIGMVESAARQKTPNEIALNIFLVTMTIIFILVTATTQVMAYYSGILIPTNYLAVLFIALAPTTIGGLLSAIGIAGMDRLVRFNVIAKSGRAVEAAGDINTLLLDKTGTITLGNRIATEFISLPGININEMAESAMLSSLMDETPEGRSILALAQSKYNIQPKRPDNADYIPFSAHTRMSGIDINGKKVRKGAVDSILTFLGMDKRATDRKDLRETVEKISRSGGTPLVVASDNRILGVIHLKDVIKPGMKERFQMLRKIGIRTVMITGDNPITAAAIAAEAGVDDFLAEATPEAKMRLIDEEQKKGLLVAMCGDGTNDAPALAKADVGLAMNTGTQAAREAGNMVDLDSDPTKLIEIITTGKQLLMTRGALTTFSISNDLAKYFAILPALFSIAYPQLNALNIMKLASPESAMLSAIIFNALIIIFLIPLALKGVKYKPQPVDVVLRKNLVTYGLGGIAVPFIGIKVIDIFVNFVGLA